MSGLNHVFARIDAQRFPLSAVAAPTGQPSSWGVTWQQGEAVEFHDDVLSYLADTLQWVPCYDPERDVSYSGLNWYGMNIVRGEGAAILARVARAWRSVFAQGPDRLTLTRHYAPDDVDDGTRGARTGRSPYETICVNRDVITATLDSLADLAESAAIHPDRYYLVHTRI